MFLKAIATIIGIIVIAGLLFALPTYWLWNWLCPTLFKLPEVTLWQALGLNLLCGILFNRGGSSKK
jgi:lipopolysaccharide export LptBFGC system permease protein LptF